MAGRRRPTPALVAGSLRRWAGPTDAPAAWGLAAHLVAGGAAGSLAGHGVLSGRALVLATVTGALVTAAGSAADVGAARRLAVAMAGLGPVAVGTAFLTSGHPWWAAAAMAAVSVTTAVAAAQGPITAVLGVLTSFGYLVTAAVVTLAEIEVEPSGVAGIVVGACAGLVVVLVRTAWSGRGRDRSAPTAGGAVWRGVLRSLRTFDGAARDGVRRAIPLAFGMYLFQSTGTRDALWVLAAAFAVLLPTGKAPLEVAALRSVATVIAVVLLGPAAAFAPVALLVAASAALLVGGVVFSGRYPLAGNVALAVAVVVAAGAPHGEIGAWATRRLIDTLAGCGLALAAIGLLWPRDPVTPPGEPFKDPTGANRDEPTAE